ncbi:hypothetical protein ATO8_11514 [Roseivivax marinus]|uniref:Anti-sigma K factor RskA C-terminal domain-containing protein n=1 Tax=Roseivivax marinus TaxID=1379903 RepID=W4HJP5_9RHOB|nr:anti-sigma factor [Roseivivax marinus]ETW12643.1 hypothetical protein ATO8_11514 [Roseivivax marinus]
MSVGVDTVGPEDGGTALAAEYVLGLMSDAESEAFEARLADEDALVDEVVLWTEYLARLVDAIPETAPAAAVKRRIEATAFGETLGRRSRSPLRQIIPYGIGGALAAMALWAAVSFGLVGGGGPEQPVLVADVTLEDLPVAIHAGYFAEAGELLVIREQGEVPAGADLELWLVQEGAAPVSLGLVPRTEERVRYPLADVVAADLGGATLAVSREPPGGSTTGLPTGPVVGTAPVLPF